MTTLYALPEHPKKEIIAEQLAKWLAQTFGVRVSITLDSGTKGCWTVEIESSDEERRK